MDEIHYRIGWRARGLVPGAHRGSQAGAGLEFRNHAPLLAASDPRRLDILGSLRDPMRRWLVRVPHQLSAIPVTLLADLSASMNSGSSHKLDVVADLATALGHSTWKTGDRFAFFGCDERLRPDFSLPASRGRATALALAERLRAWQPDGRSAEGLLTAAQFLPGGRGLVFVASDWAFPLPLARRLLDALARHDVVPVVIGDAPGTDDTPTSRWGARWLLDAESGQRRLVLLRPALAERMARARAAHEEGLAAEFRHHGRRPLHLAGRFNAQAVNRYFTGSMAA